MPSKKKKYNARFPAGRIKRIMQSDEEVGKVAQAVPIIISRTLELFVESLLTKTLKITNSRNAKTLSTSHMKQCIMSEQRFDFLRELVKNIPDISVAEEAANYNEEDNQSSPEEHYPDSDTPYDLSMPSTSVRAVRQQQLQNISNGHNNSYNNNGGAQYEFQRNHLKRSISSNAGSVIRHTTSAVMQTSAAECLPAKIARSDSTPVVPQHPMSLIPTTLQELQHPRLKHQSYSMPTATIDNNNCNKPKMNCLTEQQQQQQLRLPTQPTAIPAPIVSIDYCNKPVVKIDYSNIPIAEISSTAPASAPANIASMSNNNSTFNFSAEPVINIDLSNIVNNATSSVATISIGTPPPPPPPSSATSLPASAAFTTTAVNNNKKTKALTNALVEQQSRNSKATMAEPFNSSSTPSSSTSSSSSLTAKANALAAAASAVATMTTAKTNNSDSYLEMDEDYDNI